MLEKNVCRSGARGRLHRDLVKRWEIEGCRWSPQNGTQSDVIFQRTTTGPGSFTSNDDESYNIYSQQADTIAKALLQLEGLLYDQFNITVRPSLYALHFVRLYPSVCLPICSVPASNSRAKITRKPKTCIGVAHVTCNSRPVLTHKVANGQFTPYRLIVKNLGK